MNLSCSIYYSLGKFFSYTSVISLPSSGVAQFPGVVSPTPTATQTVVAVPKRPEPAVNLPQNGPSQAPVAEPSPSPLRDPEVDPIDAAAHLQLLGESLSLIGRRLQETEVRHTAIDF